MKNKRVYLLSIIFLCMACLFLLNTKSYAGSQTIKDLRYYVQLNDDGSADVVEIWEIYVEDTNTLFKTFDLDSSRYGEITNVTVSERNIFGDEMSFTKTNSYAYHLQKGYYYALQMSSKEFEIAWGASLENTTATKTYQIRYTIVDAVKNYNDCSEFYWQFVGTSNAVPADKVTGTIKLPSGVKEIENLKVWAHGPLNGKIYATSNDTVTFEINSLDAQTMLEVRIATAENVFTQNENVVSADRLSDIISEETAWADAANSERNKVKIIIGCVIAVNVCIFIFIVFKMVKYIKELGKTEKIRVKQEIKYYRDFPDNDATAAEAAFLYYFDKKSAFKNNLSKVLSATMLNLALKKLITFEKDERDEVKIIINSEADTSSLQVDEANTYNLLKNIEKSVKSKKLSENEVVGISMKDIEKYAKRHDTEFLFDVERLEKFAEIINEDKQKYDSERMDMAEKWSYKGFLYYVTALFTFSLGIAFVVMLSPLFTFLPSWMNCLPIIQMLTGVVALVTGITCKIIAKRTRTLTQKGVDEQEQWKALKRYMEDFSLLDEREVPELALWEKYLVYATAFGIADKVLKQLKVKYPELMDENYIINNGYAYIYMMNRYNFDRVLTSSMQRAYSAGLRERAARAAASSYSSGGGGGGGFSGGGRTAAVVGGRNGRKIETAI